MDRAQEATLSHVAVPSALYADRASVGQDELRYIERVGMAVLGQPSAGHVVHWPAGVGARDFHLDDRRTQMRARRRFNDALHPALDRWHHRATQHRRWFHRYSAIRRRHHFERPLGATNAWAAESRAALQKRGFAYRPGSQAGLLFVGAPGFMLGDKVRLRTASPREKGCSTNDKTDANATEHPHDRRMRQKKLTPR